MVKIKRVLKREEENKRKSFREIFEKDKNSIKIADSLISVKVVGRGTYKKSDKEMLDRLYDRYRKEIGLSKSDYLTRHFWNGVSKGEYLAVVAVEKKNGKPLGFIRLVHDKEYGMNRFWLGDYYTVPEARNMEIATKLGKKAYMLARMKGISEVHSSLPVSPGGAASARKIAERQKEWAKIPQERFPNFGDFMAELKKRKHFK
jgi:GNAT superfamily N-acetyltransferase